MNPKTIKENLLQHVKYLSSEIGERNICVSDTLKKAELYIIDQISSYKLSSYRQAYHYNNTEVANIIASASDDKLREYYLVGAHYDTVKGSPGADDNASAVSVLLECCRLFSEEGISTPFKFVFFTLEERPAYHTPFMGSTVFAQNARAADETILGAIILEMVGYTAQKQSYPFPLNVFGYRKTGDFLGIVGNCHSNKFSNTLIDLFEQSGNLPLQKAVFPGKGKLFPVSRKSDHASFWDYNYRAVMLTDTSFLRNPHYHKQSDTYDTLDYDFMTSLVLNLFNVMKKIR